jgi:molybdopterin adenylyltransferase
MAELSVGGCGGGRKGKKESAMGYADHKELAAGRSVACAVITCSDTRTVEEDESGRIIRELLQDAGHTHPFYKVIKDDPAAIRQLLAELCARKDVQAIILNGGTGIARRDNTFDAVRGMLTRELPGFGEIFRMLSYESIGSGAMLSRATAGVIVTPLAPPTGAAGPAEGSDQNAARHTIVFSVPGSPNAVELAMTRLILPELSHLVWETVR